MFEKIKENLNFNHDEMKIHSISCAVKVFNAQLFNATHVQLLYVYSSGSLLLC
jgi:hypothetical protein